MFQTIDEIFTYAETEVLEETEEARLIEQAQQGDEEATLTLMKAYGPALRAAVSNFGNGVIRGRSPWDGDSGLGTSAFEESDVRNAVVVGFLETIKDHDAAKSPRLAGRVRQRIARELADLYEATMPFRVPERTLSRFYGILSETDGDEERAVEIAPDYGMSRETFREILAAVRKTSSLDAEMDGRDDSYRAQTGGTGVGGDAGVLARPVRTPSPVVDVEDKILVEMAFRAVDDEEARICELGYGFTEYEPVPDAEIAFRMGLTRPTVQRKRNKALGKMRKALGVAHV